MCCVFRLVSCYRSIFNDYGCCSASRFSKAIIKNEWFGWKREEEEGGSVMFKVASLIYIFCFFVRKSTWEKDKEYSYHSQFSCPAQERKLDMMECMLIRYIVYTFEEHFFSVALVGRCSASIASRWRPNGRWLRWVRKKSKGFELIIIYSALFATPAKQNCIITATWYEKYNLLL